MVLPCLVLFSVTSGVIEQGGLSKMNEGNIHREELIGRRKG